MGEQPGAGRTHSFKIKGHSRQRRAAKPYSRPSDRNKGVLESVRDFFSPSWLLDFWKGKNVVEEDESEDFDDENSGEEPAGISQDFGSSSRVMERAGPSTSERVSDTRQELLGNGGPGFMASAQKRSRTSQKSGLSALLALRPREPLNKKALETKTTAFASSTGEYSRSNEYTSSYMESVETKEGESLTHESRKTISESGPSPILSSSQSKPGSSLFFGARRTSTESRPSPLLSSSQSKPGPSPIFGTSLTPGASSTPVSSQPTPGPSLLSTERSSSRHQPTSVFRSKPEFSLSAFGSVLPSRSNLQTQRYSSPYYSGKTIFGGASSQASSKRARTSSPGSAEASKPVKRQIRPTPIAGTSGGGVTSQTAKRILETLERMSSPLEDAKKIPPSPPFATSSSPLSFSSKRRKAPPQPYNKPIGSPRKLQMT
ncbi:Nuclear pore complex protein Nup153 [Exaiptasia diaphana]|nr:Nuclear pore complex protein Nup153 [Exaiptasia diaphana]